MTAHYIAILVPEQSGGWAVIFPDLPGCATHGPTVHEAITAASGVASTWLAATRASGETMPALLSYEDIRSDGAWALDCRIDWSTAVISLVQVDAAP
jgi:predicted RNase H-like HicB family nuclease